MINIQDLHIEKELLPLLDFTKNDFSKKVLIELLMQPLGSLDEIYQRQNLIKGFIANYDILKNFAYSRIDLLEVMAFLKQSNSLITIKEIRSFNFSFQGRKDTIKQVSLFR